MSNISLLATNVVDVVNTLEPFAFCKPLAEAIARNNSLEVISEPVSTLLFFLDIFFIVTMVASVGFLVFAFIKYGLEGLKGKDETKDLKEIEKERKWQLKRSVKAFIILAIVFILIPIVITIVGAII